MPAERSPPKRPACAPTHKKPRKPFLLNNGLPEVANAGPIYVPRAASASRSADSHEQLIKRLASFIKQSKARVLLCEGTDLLITRAAVEEARVGPEMSPSGQNGQRTMGKVRLRGREVAVWCFVSDES
jgi:hypothetical protein